MTLTTDLPTFLRDGCGRCEKFATDACKVRRWREVLDALRDTLLQTGLTETMKWGSPCYTDEGRNIVLLAALTDACTLGFVEGAGLDDPDGVLELPGPNSHRDRVLRVRSVDEARRLAPTIRRLVEGAVARRRAGEAPAPAPPLVLPDELSARLAADPALQAAFDALTPGRRRSHALHVGGAKAAATRARRAEACAPIILAGRGFNER